MLYISIAGFTSENKHFKFKKNYNTHSAGSYYTTGTELVTEPPKTDWRAMCLIPSCTNNIS